MAASVATLFAVTAGNDVMKVAPAGTDGNIVIKTTGGGGPTGQVANPTSSFLVGGNGADNQPAHFIFANLNGTISAWDMGQNAFVQVTTPNAVCLSLRGLYCTPPTMLLAALTSSMAPSSR